MKTIRSIVILAGWLLLSWSPQLALAHGGRWGCGSYYGGYTYYYPRYYYPTYSSCSSYYGNSYVPYPSYGYNALYNNLGFGLGGGNILGLLAGNGLAGANLSGSLMQPSYLSMPVSVGYGQSGFLQIPLGNPSGRATYLQIPVNTGYGPSSYLQIELGRRAASGTTAPGTPTPSAVPNVPPFGAVPGVNSVTGAQLTFDTPRTPRDEVPPIVSPEEHQPKKAIAALATQDSAAPSAHSSDDSLEKSTRSAFEFVSWNSTPLLTKSPAPTATSRAIDTSFSLVDATLESKAHDGSKPQASVDSQLALTTVREDTPWVVK